MNTRYTGTDETEDGPIRWYEVEGETYGFDPDGMVLDANEWPLPAGSEHRAVLMAIAVYEAFK